MYVITVRWPRVIRPLVLQYTQVIVFVYVSHLSQMQISTACDGWWKSRCISPGQHSLARLCVHAAGQYQMVDSPCKRRRCSFGNIWEAQTDCLYVITVSECCRYCGWAASRCPPMSYYPEHSLPTMSTELCILVECATKFLKAATPEGTNPWMWALWH